MHIIYNYETLQWFESYITACTAQMHLQQSALFLSIRVKQTTLFLFNYIFLDSSIQNAQHVI